MTEIVPHAVAAAICEIKGSNRCNMMNQGVVSKIASELGYVEFVDWLKDNSESYIRCLNHGYLPDEAEDVEIEETAEVSVVEEKPRGGSGADDIAGIHEEVQFVLKTVDDTSEDSEAE